MKMTKWILACAAASMLCLTQAMAQEHNDADHVLEVNRAIPEFMIQGPHFRIVDPVINRFALDEFTIESDFGTFEVIGQLQLRMRLREIQAIAALRELNTTAVAKGAIIREAGKTVTAVAQVGRHPIRSAKGIASGIGKRFMKWGRDVVEDVQIARAKDLTRDDKKKLLADRWLGVDESKLRLAGTLFIDPYSQNPVLQDELNLVARAEAGANIGTKLLIPSIPVASFMKDVHKIVTTYDYRELLEHNRERLIGLGADVDDIEQFLTLEHYTPTMASLAISLILELDGVQNQLALFDQALAADSSVDALFLIDCIAMAAWYHNNRTPLQSMYLATGLPAGRTVDGQLLVFAATDFPHWTHVQADVVAQLDVAYKAYSAHPVLLLAGNASGEFKREVEALDWSVEIGLRNEYLTSLPWAITDVELQTSE